MSETPTLSTANIYLVTVYPPVDHSLGGVIISSQYLETWSSIESSKLQSTSMGHSGSLAVRGVSCCAKLSLSSHQGLGIVSSSLFRGGHVSLENIIYRLVVWYRSVVIGNTGGVPDVRV
ncbi:hypothetical protein Tco_0126993 [Tanacetum coccineum]